MLVDRLYTWIGAGVGDPRFTAEIGLRLDPLSAVMALVVTGVGFLIHVYSIGYMDDDHRDDRGFQRFFGYLNLFTFSMLMLVLADNLVLMFVGWEGVGPVLVPADRLLVQRPLQRLLRRARRSSSTASATSAS